MGNMLSMSSTSSNNSDLRYRLEQLSDSQYEEEEYKIDEDEIIEYMGDNPYLMGPGFLSESLLQQRGEPDDPELLNNPYYQGFRYIEEFEQ